jgi:hypothetical protein
MVEATHLEREANGTTHTPRRKPACATSEHAGIILSYMQYFVLGQHHVISGVRIVFCRGGNNNTEQLDLRYATISPLLL